MAAEDREELDISPSEQEPPAPENGAEPAQRKRPIEKFYDNFENVPLKALDIFICVCIVLLIAVVVIGYIRSHS